MILEMVTNSTRFAHAGGADNNGGFFDLVEFHGLGQLTDVGKILHSEGVFLLAQKAVDVGVETFGVEPVDLGGIGAERAVDVDRGLGEAAVAEQLVQRIDDLLGATDREGWDNDDATLSESGGD